MRTPRSGELAAKHVVILGAGVDGLYAARALRGAPARATLIDRRNHHLFQPLLSQVAAAALSPSEIASPGNHDETARSGRRSTGEERPSGQEHRPSAA